MSTTCNTCNCQDSQSHTNAFLNLNGIPYLVAEYLDRRTFQQLDRSVVKSDLFIDQSDCMRTIVDISIDDIGRKSSGGLNVIGNATKQKSLINMIKTSFHMLDHQLPVLKRGIVIRVNYHLENKRTGHVLRSMQEDLRIFDRNYFISINSDDINDNAIITNFSNSMVSTINHFTHGMDPMILRITNIEMYYECVKLNPLTPRVPQSMITDPRMAQYFYGCDADVYKHHQKFQHRHIMSSGFGNECLDEILPPGWTMFNRFYHFDESGSNIIIHDQEVYDRKTHLIPVPCGTVQIDRAFMINPGSRIIFKLSIWKNDLTVVNNTIDIAKALKAPIYPCYGETETDPSDKDCKCDTTDKTSEMDYAQNMAINQLNTMVAALMNLVKEMHPEAGDNNGDHEIPPLPESPDSDVKEPPCCQKPQQKPNHPGGHGKPSIKAIFNKIAELQKQIEAIQNGDCDCDDITPIPNDWISDMVKSLDEETGAI